MKRIILATAIGLVATAAMAQTPPATPTPADSSASNATPPPPLPGNPPPPGMRPGGPPPHMGHGAFIKLKGPGGAEIAVRCSDGEPTRACANVVEQLMNRVAQMRMERMQHRREQGGGWENRRGGGDGDRDNHDDRDRDHDRD